MLTKRLIQCALVLSAAMCLTSLHAQQPAPRASIMTSANTGPLEYQQTVNAYLNGIKPKVIGGIEAAAGAYPWQVSLDVSWIANPYASHFCGGSVYSDHWIITAAHCVNTLEPKDIVVSAGTNTLSEGRTRRNVRQIIVHSAYDHASHDNDIALLELFGDPLRVSDAASAIRAITPMTLTAESFTTGLGSKAATRSGTWFEVTGWGAISENGDQVPNLRMAFVPYRPSKSDVPLGCKRGVSYGNAVTDNMLCAGADGDACQGDSGGPLILREATSPKLVGIVSWGTGCARPNKPGVYTRVAKYELWIRACTASPASCP